MQPFSKPCLLPSESESDYLSLRAAIAEDMQPKRFLQWLLVDDITNITWEIFRTRRMIIDIICTGFLPALQSILAQALYSPSFLVTLMQDGDATDLSNAYFRTKQGKQAVLKIFRELGLSESCIEAESRRLQNSDLEKLDIMLAKLEKRRYRVLRFDKQLVRQIQHTTNRVFAKAERGLDSAASIHG
jgi:hypothetical protein